MRTKPFLSARRILGAALLFPLALALPACEADPEEVPEIAQVESTVTGETDLRELWPLENLDAGEVVMATGTVTGTADTTGFFLRTEGDRVLFVAGQHTAMAGQTVRVVGTVREVVVSTFEGWERDFLGGVEAEWDVARTHYIEATSVTPI